MPRGHPLPGPQTPQAAERPVPPGAAPPAPHWHSLELGSRGLDRGQGAGRPHLPGPLPRWALGVRATQRPPPTRLARVAPTATGGRPGPTAWSGYGGFLTGIPASGPAVSPSDPLSPHGLPQESPGSWAE